MTARGPQKQISRSIRRPFKELELPKLPVLEKQNRARLQVQSPNNVYFYWSLKANPVSARSSRTLGTETAGYSLVLRLLDTQTEREEIHPIELEGSYWFNTDAGRTYRSGDRPIQPEPAIRTYHVFEHRDDAAKIAFVAGREPVRMACHVP